MSLRMECRELDWRKPQTLSNKVSLISNRFPLNAGIYIFWPFPPLPPGGGGKFVSKLNNREEFEGGLEKRKRGKKKKKEKRDKTHVKILYVNN